MIIVGVRVKVRGCAKDHCIHTYRTRLAYEDLNRLFSLYLRVMLVVLVLR
jgi:hypothetical protein